MPNEYFKGEKLYGDDFNESQIKEWFDHEAEAYANLSANNPISDVKEKEYGYHALNEVNGYRHISLPENTIALGIGAAYGAEFLPVKNSLKEIHILEPSDQLVAEKLDNIPLIYQKPDITGKMPYSDNMFDLITCFGTLHHIPNVSYVVSELARVLKPGGVLLIREPIISMGDWDKPRKGLTKHERGIPLKLFRKMFSNSKLKIVKETPCLTMLFVLQKILKRTLYTNKFYLKFDVVFSKLLLFNYHYHATSKLQRIAPNNVFYILKK